MLGVTRVLRHCMIPVNCSSLEEKFEEPMGFLGDS